MGQQGGLQKLTIVNSRCNSRQSAEFYQKHVQPMAAIRRRRKKKHAHQAFYPDTIDAVLINRQAFAHIIRLSRAGSLGCDPAVSAPPLHSLGETKNTLFHTPARTHLHMRPALGMQKMHEYTFRLTLLLKYGSKIREMQNSKSLILVQTDYNYNPLRVWQQVDKDPHADRRPAAAITTVSRRDSLVACGH